jgi:hypothetical protein
MHIKYGMLCMVRPALHTNLFPIWRANSVGRKQNGTKVFCWSSKRSLGKLSRSCLLLNVVRRAFASQRMGTICQSLLVRVQGLPTLVGLVEDSFAENGHLTTIGVGCIWRILELHVHTSLNHLCRLLSFAGLAHRLARTLCAVNSEYLYAAAQVCAPRTLLDALVVQSSTRAWGGMGYGSGRRRRKGGGSTR